MNSRQQAKSLEDVLYEHKTQLGNQYTTKYPKLSREMRQKRLLETSHKPIKTFRDFLQASETLVFLLFFVANTIRIETRENSTRKM